MLVGNGFGVYYSCGKRKVSLLYLFGKASITGGIPNFNYKSDGDPIAYPCFKSGGPNIIGHELMQIGN